MTSENQRKSVRLHITGLVQGVGYRASLAARAQALQLSGSVKNRLDGSVDALVSGPDEAVDELIAWARRGPPAARVSSVRATDASDERMPDGGDFEILPTD
jgi:acylphosphatase